MSNSKSASLVEFYEFENEGKKKSTEGNSERDKRPIKRIIKMV